MEYVLNLHSSYSIFCCLYIYTYSKLVNTLKKYAYKTVSFTDAFEKKVEVMTKELIKKIEQFYEYLYKDEDFTSLKNSLNNCLADTEDNVNKVFEEIKLW
jgi:predicted transcriptional regulator